jgi:tetratricopeptide (TPR) repeat protein
MNSPPGSRLFSATQIGIMLAILVILAVACQYLGFKALMVYDEAYFIKSKEPVFAQHDVLRLIAIVPVRPLFLFSFYVNYLVTGMDPFFFRLTNALMVAAGGLALAFVAALLFDIPHLRVPGSRSARLGVSFFLAALFVAHPLQSFVVLYAWQREAIMGYLFYYAALAVYLGLRSGRILSATRGYILCSVLFLLGMVSKENVATLPLAMILMEVTLFRQSWKETCRKALTLGLFMVPAALLYLAITRFLHQPDSELVQGIVPRLIDHYQQSGLQWWEVILTECRVFFSYVGMMLFPVPANMEFMRSEVISRSLLDPPVTGPAVAGVSALVATGVILIRRKPIIAFGILFMFLSLAPESLLIPQYLNFGYRAILPMAGLLLVLGYGLLAVIGRWEARESSERLRTALVAAALIPVVSLAVLTAVQAKRWNYVSFWTTLVDRLPPFSRNVEIVPFLDIAVNCMSTLAFAEKHTEGIDIFRRVLAPQTPSDGREPSAHEDLRPTIEAFAEKFKDQTMRAGGALICLGISLQTTGRNPEAILAYERALEIEPHHTDVHQTVGTLLELAGQMPAAIEHYRQALKIDPGSDLSHNCLGNALKKTGHTQEAMQEFAAAVEAAPQSVAGYLNLGLAYQEAGYYREAVDLYVKALEVAPQSAEAHHKLGRALAETGNREEALAQYRSALALDPGMALAHSDLALALEQSGNVLEAIEHYQLAIQKDPNSAIYHAFLGKALTAAGRPQEAVEVLNRATQLDPGMALAYRNLGAALEKTGDTAGALAALQRAVRIDPGTAAAYLDLGRVFARAGRQSDAVQALTAAIRLDPRNGATYVDLGRLLERMGDTSLAQAQYRRALQVEPTSADAAFRLANNLLRNGQALEAAQFYDRAVQLKPDFADAHANKALALLHAGNIPEGIVALARALSLNKDRAQVLYALGCAFAHMKKDAAAAEYLEKAKETGQPVDEFPRSTGRTARDHLSEQHQSR